MRYTKQLLRSRSRRVVLLTTVVALTVACRPSSEIRPSFTQERRAPEGALEGSVVYTSRDRQQTSLYEIDLSSRRRSVKLSSARTDERSPSLSPDSRLIASAVAPPSGHGGIYVRPASGGPLRPVITGEGVFDYPSWSPDGRRIAYARTNGPQSDWDLFIADVATGAERRLTRGGGQDWDPAWSPKGDFIAFTSDRSGDDAIWLFDVAASRATKLKDSSGRDTQPAWSPDGRRLAYSSDREAHRWQLFVLDIESGAERRVIRTNAMDRFPTWSPDGRYLLVSVGYLAVYRVNGGKFPDGADRWRVGGRLALSSSWVPG